MKINNRTEMDRYFNLDIMNFERPKAELVYLSGQLLAVTKEEHSEIIALFGLEPLKVYLEKHQELGNKFSFSTIEPFMIYLDRYLIEHSGGNLEELNKLSKSIVGKELKYPTSRLMRMGILKNYFSPYLA